MKLSRMNLATGILLFCGASTAWAVPTIAVEQAVVPGGTASTVITITHTEASPNTTQAGSFNVTYNTSKLSSNAATICAGLVGTWGCSENVVGTIVFASSYVELGSLPNLSIDITFDLTGADVPSNNPLNVTNPLYLVGDAEFVNPNVTNGSIEILPPPQPAFSSNPTPAAGVVVTSVIQNAPDTTANVFISNSGAASSTLTGSCTETADPDNVFSLSGDTSFSVLQGTTDTVVVTCDSAGDIGPHSGEMTCTHNGATGLSSPQLYNLSCEITTGPQPAYSSSNPTAGGAINLAVAEAGDSNPSQNMTITNSGDLGTTLTGNCAMGGMGDPQITLTTAGGFSIAQGAAGSIKTVSCDASVQGTYNGTLSCTHNGSAPASPVNYAVSCVVPEAGAAVFGSNPVPGPVDIANGADVVVGDPDPTRNLTFINLADDEDDQNLDVSCSVSGDPQITVSPDPFDASIQPLFSTGVNLICDTDTAGSFTSTYTCYYENGGVDTPVSETGTQVIYNLSCDVREPEAEVEITPAPGTPQTKSVPPNGSTSFTFDFEEINDEGEDGNLISCDLETGGQGFTVSSPTFPIDVLSGDTVTVVVDFTDPTGADSWSDTLTCMFGDSDDDDTEVSWPLTVNIGGDARFTVLKDFTDGNPGDVIVDLDCNTGLILDQQKSISEDGIGVTFVVTDFDPGELDCNVTERPVAGYNTSYDPTGSDSDYDTSDDGVDGCFYYDVAGGDENTCLITNDPDYVDVVITKEWVYPGSADGSSISTDFKVVLYCDTAEIEGGSVIGGYIGTTESPASWIDPCAFDYYYPFADNAQLIKVLPDQWCKTLYGSGNTTFEEQVKPYDWPGGSCWATEVDVDQAVEVDNGCASSMEVSAGSGASCTITNTVFFEGIPTLSQYGMALMALLMLGVGFVAMRRIV